MARPQPRTLIALDLLRFACALLVVSLHYGAGYSLLPPPGASTLLAGMPVDTNWIGFTSSGWIGVELFFVISGFVIAWSAEGSEALAFLGRRALRLAPAAWICALFTTAALLIWSQVPVETVLRQWLSSVVFWPSIPTIDPSYWTLGIEVNFYLLVAVILLRGSSLERIERLGAALGMWSCSYWLAACFLPVPSDVNRMIQLSLLPHGCFFALGILIRARQRLGHHPLRMAYFVPAAIAALIEIEVHRIETYAAGPVHVPVLLFGLGLLPILFAERIQPWLARHVRASLATTIGLMTYPLYLLHQELSAMLIGGLLHAGLRFWPAAALALLAMLALAWGVARFAEPALRAVLKRRAPAASMHAVPLGEIAV